MVDWKKDLNEDKECIYRLKGTFDSVSAASEFQDVLQCALDEPESTIIFDLSEVSSLNSSALGKILMFKEKFDRKGKSVSIKGCSETVFSVLSLVGAQKTLSVERKAAD